MANSTNTSTFPIQPEHADPEPGAIAIIKRSEGITTIAMNRPKKRNAIDIPTAKKLYSAFLDFEADASQKICVLHGNGGTFSSGFDLTQLATWHGELPNMAQHSSITRGHFEPVRGENIGPLGPTRMHIRKPVICAVSGYAVAGGLELSLLGDLRVVDEDAIFEVSCRKLGVPLLDGGTVRLPQIIGLGRALDIILTGRAITAKEALNIGLASRVVPKGQSLDEAMKLARMLVSYPQECLNVDRQSCYYAVYHAHSLEDALSQEFEAGSRVSDMAIEAALAFVQKSRRQSKL
ncbi:enoyl-CoA hydratase [Histoplasma capsulatum G186AR]|uniref:Enoyl-CoA hydratase n=1 Tax=Ajellomyces capsulatus (strain G186AR / H82 / ATCC MYA-2454 / RMSCC 2432) TaxID=447093 RepID=C0NTB2_AJECG|nr:enoyl-CoA hydratase [Histoplasma capsulatum G186AR]EEH05273.1 enoyl-CoA hydratase [Histoplasma capsulatum G186AR]